jgi:thiol-disulfide isomerase/thioredoxin
MPTAMRLAVIAGLVLAVAVTVALRRPARDGPIGSEAPSAALPRLLDIGADQCIPRKAMVPVLAELRQEYAGHRGVLAAAGASGPRLARYGAWSERGVSVLRRVCGVLVLAGGLCLVYAAP